MGSRQRDSLDSIPLDKLLEALNNPGNKGSRQRILELMWREEEEGRDTEDYMSVETE
jgi:hypothetical protein